MNFSDQQLFDRFPVGYYPLHSNVSLNFQMNRFWNGPIANAKAPSFTDR